MKQEAKCLFNQGDLNRLQKMLDKEVANRVSSGWEDSKDLRETATVTVPMNVWKGEVVGGLHCSVNTVGALEQGLL